MLNLALLNQAIATLIKESKNQARVTFTEKEISLMREVWGSKYINELIHNRAIRGGQAIIRSLLKSAEFKRLSEIPGLLKKILIAQGQGEPFPKDYPWAKSGYNITLGSILQFGLAESNSVESLRIGTENFYSSELTNELGLNEKAPVVEVNKKIEAWRIRRFEENTLPLLTSLSDELGVRNQLLDDSQESIHRQEELDSRLDEICRRINSVESVEKKREVVLSGMLASNPSFRLPILWEQVLEGFSFALSDFTKDSEELSCLYDNLDATKSEEELKQVGVSSSQVIKSRTFIKFDSLDAAIDHLLNNGGLSNEEFGHFVVDPLHLRALLFMPHPKFLFGSDKTEYTVMEVFKALCKKVQENKETYKSAYAQLSFRLELVEEYLDKIPEIERKPARFHPLLPTLEEAKTNPEQVFSDHLPIISTVPLEACEDKIKLISWNVMTPNGAASGFGNCEAVLDESGERKKRIVDSVLKMINEQTPDVFFLQEVWEDLDKALATALEAIGWKMLPDKNGIPILWNPTRVTINADDYMQDQTSPDRFMSGTRKVNCQFGGTSLILANAYWEHQDLPFTAEERIDRLGKIANEKKHQLIFAGDFNNRIVPKNKKFLVNNVVPPLFREGKQGADWTDGVFYHVGNQETRCHQLEFQVVNPSAGTLFQDDMMQNASFNKFQKEEISTPRVCLDIEHGTCGEPKFYLSSSDSSRLSDNGFKLRSATNAYNSPKVVAMCASSNDRAAGASYRQLSNAFQNQRGCITSTTQISVLNECVIIFPKTVILTPEQHQTSKSANEYKQKINPNLIIQLFSPHYESAREQKKQLADTLKSTAENQDVPLTPFQVKRITDNRIHTELYRAFWGESRAKKLAQQTMNRAKADYSLEYLDVDKFKNSNNLKNKLYTIWANLYDNLNNKGTDSKKDDKGKFKLFEDKLCLDALETLIMAISGYDKFVCSSGKTISIHLGSDQLLFDYAEEKKGRVIWHILDSNPQFEKLMKGDELCKALHEAKHKLNPKGNERKLA